MDDETYRKISNTRRTNSPNLIVPRLVLQLSLPNPMKPGVKSRMIEYYTSVIPKWWGSIDIYNIYFWSELNNSKLNCARATAFIFDTRTDVLLKVSTFLRQKMSRSGENSNPLNALRNIIHLEPTQHCTYSGNISLVTSAHLRYHQIIVWLKTPLKRLKA